MKVFKFGGASVKDAASVRNVASIVSLFKGEKMGIVVSAMGKTTNAMEKIADALWESNEADFKQRIDERKTFHVEIMNELFREEENEIFSEIATVFNQLYARFDQKRSETFNAEYDQIVSLGEIVSTKIVEAFLAQEGISSGWVDARKLIVTNDGFREAELDWKTTEENFQTHFMPLLNEKEVLVTQGFIGCTKKGFTSTLGREGSDFTAGIIAYCCNAESVTIWKDVPGMLNADPKWFEDTIKLEQISFREAIELSYYGASVIHPKTIKPLQNKQIPLYVKSFLDPQADGTKIQSSTENDHLIPSYICKMDQVLFLFTPKDFSFIVERNLSDIFERLAQLNVKINLMQNSALNFSILLDQAKVNIPKLLALFEETYDVTYNEGLELITIRHYDQVTIDKLTQEKEILVQQKTRDTARIIVRQCK